MTDTVTRPSPDVQIAPRRRIALVASKGTLDQAYPPLILATTAASLGWEAGVYFTFYGLDIIHEKRLESLKVASLANPAGPPLVHQLSTEEHQKTATSAIWSAEYWVWKKSCRPGLM